MMIFEPVTMSEVGTTNLAETATVSIISCIIERILVPFWAVGFAGLRMCASFNHVLNVVRSISSVKMFKLITSSVVAFVQNERFLWSKNASIFNKFSSVDTYSMATSITILGKACPNLAWLRQHISHKIFTAGLL